MSRKLAYMCHCYGGKTENLIKAKRWLKWCLAAFPEIDFDAPWILWCEVLDETTANRERGLKFDEEVIRRFDYVFVVGPEISSGIVREMHMAAKHDRAIIDLGRMDEPPSVSEGLSQQMVIRARAELEKHETEIEAADRVLIDGFLRFALRR